MRRGKWAALWLLAAVACGAPSAPANRGPARVITLLPNLTEIVVALGAGNRIVGCTSYCPRASLAAEVADMGTPLSPSLERIAALRPDLVLMQDTQHEARDRLRAMGLRAEDVPAVSFADVFTAVRRIAELLGLDRAGVELAERIRSELAGVAARIRGRPPVRTLVVIGHDRGALRQIFLAGPDSFITNLLVTAGGENVLPKSPIPYPVVGVEEILKLNPEAVLVLAPDEEDTPAAQERERRLWSALSYLNAVKNGRVYLLADRDILTPGPRMGETAARFARLLHPESTP